jgi:hypothetical protein
MSSCSAGKIKCQIYSACKAINKSTYIKWYIYDAFPCWSCFLFKKKRREHVTAFDVAEILEKML